MKSPTQLQLQQNTPQWLRFKLGKLSGSRMGSAYSDARLTKNDIIVALDQHGCEYKPGWTKDKLVACLPDDVSVEMLGSYTPSATAYEILAERLTDSNFKDPSIPEEEMEDLKGLNPMSWGNVMEPRALERYQEELTTLKDEIGIAKGIESFIGNPVFQSPANRNLIVSMDGYWKRILAKSKIEVGVESKCMTSKRHLESFLESRPQKDHWGQIATYFIAHPLLAYVDYIIYDPRFYDPKLRFKIIKIERAEFQEQIEKYERFINQFEDWAGAITSQYETKF